MHFKIFLVCISMFFLNDLIVGQKLSNRDLLETVDKFNKDQIKNREIRINQWIKRINSQENQLLSKARKDGLVLVDVVKNHPIFEGINDADAKFAVGIDSTNVLLGGDNKLEGEGIEIGIWDGGIIRTTHQEIDGKVSYFDNAVGDLSDHATGVAGVILSSGVDSRSIGMAPKATGIAYDFNNDEGEMIQTQMLRNILLSNHSYGIIGGWHNGQWFGDASISDKEDYKFGFYNTQAQTWDMIAFNSPNYLIVKSSGNDRGESGDGSFPADGPYDCITGAGNAKNVLTVGSINKSSSDYNIPDELNLSSFSSWGPTDDGRVKPDLVGVGANIFMAGSSSDIDYWSSQGTSFSTPNVCGGLILVQEYYNRLYNKYMNAATLKAIAIHNAQQVDDFPGPNYRSGWGLLKVNRVIDFINGIDGNGKQLIESTLEEGEEVVFDIAPQSNSNIKVTLAWNDPAGTPVSPSLDPDNLMLVNDLDLFLRDPEGNLTEVYVLDPENPENPATIGNNIRDNIEQLNTTGLLPIEYELVVTHKGELENGRQNFSLIIEYEPEGSSAQNLYWVGNSGQWSDTEVWSNNSGGESIDLSPTSSNRLIIDDRSVGESGDTIFMESDYAISSLAVFTNRNFVLDLQGHSLEVSNGLIASSNNLSIINGSIILKNNDVDANFFINLGNTITNNLSIVLDEDNFASWQFLNSSLMVEQITAYSGTIILDNVIAVVESIELGLDGKFVNVDISNSTVEGLSSFVVNDMVNFDTDQNSNLVFNNPSEIGRIVVDNNHLPIPIRIENDSIQINSTEGRLDDLVVQGSYMEIIGNFSLGALSFSDANTLVISEGDSLSVLGDIIFENGENVLNIASTSEEKAYLNIISHQKYCLDNIVVANVDLLGFSAISVGVNGSIVNSLNWSNLACDDVLFADFEVDYLCENALSSIQSTSEGNIAEYLWEINNQEVSRDSEFEYVFEESGNYLLKLTVEDVNGESKFWEDTLRIVENNLDINEIIQNSTSLVSRVSGDRYQWFRNGEPIEGATMRTLPYNGELAVFFVVVYKEDCNRKSNDIDFTSSVININDSDLIKITPNPFRNRLIIDASKIKDKIETINFYNLMGQRIYTLQPHNKVTEVNISTDISSFIILELVAGNNTYVKRLQKM